MEESKLKCPGKWSWKDKLWTDLKHIEYLWHSATRGLGIWSWFVVVFFSNQKLVATTTNLFINGFSLHGSHQVIISASKNSDKSCDWSVTGPISSP